MASALAGLMPGRAAAREAARCDPESPPSAADLETARALYREGALALEAGDHDGAIRSLTEAYARSGKVELLAALGRARRIAGDPAGAVRDFEHLLECRPDSAHAATIADDLERALAESAEFRVKTEPPGATVTVDDQEIGVTSTDAPLGARVNAGQREIVVSWPNGSSARRTFSIAAGDTVEAIFEPDTDPCEFEPCVCLQPCLSPPPPPRLRSNRLDLELGYRLWFDAVRDERTNTGHVATASFAWSTRVFDQGALRFGAFVGAASAPSGTLFPVGGQVQFSVTSHLAFMGLGLDAGYVFASASTLGRDFSPEASLLLAPHALVGVNFGEHLGLGVQMGPVFSRQASRDQASFRMGWISSGVFLRYAFGAGCEAWDGSPEPCWDDVDDVARF